MKSVYIVKYSDGMYHEDDSILGVFWTDEEARACIQKECLSYYPPMHRAYSFWYSILEMPIEDEPT